MAIVTEQYEINGRSFTRTYSDCHRCVVRDGESYSEANDPTELGRVYTEGELIEEEATEEDKMQELLNILMGEQE